MNPPILIVEDSRHDILLAERAFARANVQAPLQIVTDGEAAMQYLSGAEPFADRQRYPIPALVLLDLKLPRRSGHEILSWIHDTPELANAGYPVVVLTTSDEARDRDMAVRSGAVGYLIKPLYQETVLEMLHSVGLDELLTSADGRGPDLRFGEQREALAPGNQRDVAVDAGEEAQQSEAPA